MNDPREVVDLIVGWLKQQLTEAKAKGLVFGLSGGLDSSVVAVLSKKATDNALALLMPCYGIAQDVDFSLKIARKFSIETKSVDLTTTFNIISEGLPKGSQLSYANIKPRLRMIVLYYYANFNNYLVVGTSNKTEIALGYFTKYGDGASDIVPLGDLYKYEVVALARELDIPEEIIKRTPSAGLWPGQTDEGEIGLTYSVIDETLLALERGETDGLEPAVVEKIQQMIDTTKHKREPPKICKIKGTGIIS